MNWTHIDLFITNTVPSATGKILRIIAEYYAFKITLSRPLEKGETVTVPFDISGGTVHEHWSMKITGNRQGLVERTSGGAQSEVVFTEGAQNARFVLIARPNSDTEDRTITISLGTGDRHPTSSGVANGVILGDNTSFTIDIIDDDKPVSIALATEKTSLLESKEKTKFTITLSRPLGAGEIINVPFDISGGTAREHWSITINGNNKSVERTSGGAQSKVKFTEGAQTATFVLTALPNSDMEDRTITISLGTGDRHPTSKRVAGGVALADSNTSFAVDIIDDDKPPPIMTIRGDNPITMFAGEEYVDAGATCTDHWGESIVPTVSGSVGILVPGTYTISYTCADFLDKTASATRTVIILDTDEPVITLAGSETVTIEAGSQYVDAGAVCTDHAGRSIVPTVDGSVDTSVPYIYNLFYSCTDIVGKTVYAVRTVTVQDTTKPVITLTGSETVTIEAGSQYVDAGAVCVDNADGPITPTTSGSVNASAPGIYTISHSCIDNADNESSAVRTVTVQDTTKPVITLKGTKTIVLEVGASYVDDGATCADSLDGPITPTTSGSVNASARGTYTITYACMDTAGNGATPVTRTVQFTFSTIQPTVSIAGGATATEGDSLDFVINLSHVYEYPVEFNYVTVDGDAIAGNDYVFVNGLIIFEPGQTEHTISIETIRDDIQEGDEEMYFETVYVAGAKREGARTVTGTISDS